MYQPVVYLDSINIADLGLALCPQTFPIAVVYVHIVAAMALIDLKRVEEAKQL